MDNADQFRRDLPAVRGNDGGKEIEELAKELPSSDRILHPHVFWDLEGKREWEAKDVGHKIISLSMEREDNSDQEDDKGLRNINGIFHLLTFL